MKKIFYFLTIIFFLMSFTIFTININKYISLKDKYEEYLGKNENLKEKIIKKSDDIKQMNEEYESNKDKIDPEKKEVYEKWKKDREEIEQYLQ